MINKPITWRFAEDKYVAFIEGPKDSYEEGSFRLDADKWPKHLDLIPTKGGMLAPCKSLFALDGDELKIAFSFWFAPGSPEDEIAEAKKMRATRPERIRAEKNDLILVIVLKRQKK